LQLAAEVNLRVANCTTAAQYFHLLRRQAALLETDPLPLFVFTPKSLLRHPTVASPPRDLAEGEWQPVLDDPFSQAHRAGVQRLIFCTGKVAVDLMTIPYRSDPPDVAIARVEQLYLFPLEHARRVAEGYPRLRELVWVQEEPANMGALSHVHPHLMEISGGRWPVRVIARPANASPAEGSAAWHAANQAKLVASALGADAVVQTRS
jgi:2-oxoglutarate dehydrogenase E1 component